MDSPETQIPNTLEARYLIKTSELEDVPISPIEPKHVVEGLERHRRHLEQDTNERILPFFQVYDSSGQKKGLTGSTEQLSQLNRIKSTRPGDLVIVDISTSKSPEELKSRLQTQPDTQTQAMLPDRNLRWIEGQNLASELDTTLHVFRVTPDGKLQPLRRITPNHPTT